MRVRKPAGFAFVAGQHVKLGADEASVMRSYSIASAPHEAHLEFCIENIAHGELSPRLSQLRAGDVVHFRGKARGRFVLDSQRDVHAMIATKTGIAPFRSMVLEALNAQERRAKFIILHGASYASELPYREELESLMQSHPERVVYIPTVSRPNEAANAGWSGRTGRVDLLAGEVLPQHLTGTRSSSVYLCGNSAMIASVRAEWSGRGFECRSEAFD